MKRKETTSNFNHLFIVICNIYTKINMFTDSVLGTLGGLSHPDVQNNNTIIIMTVVIIITIIIIIRVIIKIIIIIAIIIIIVIRSMVLMKT